MDRGISSTCIRAIHDIVVDESACVEEFKRCHRLDRSTIWALTCHCHRADGTEKWAKALTSIDEEVAHRSGDWNELWTYRFDVGAGITKESGDLFVDLTS
jgi:hypothetical protein